MTSPHESDHLGLQDAIAGLLHLTIEDRGHLNSYDISTCDEKLQELMSYLTDLEGRLQRTIREVLGQIALLYHCKAQLQVIVLQLLSATGSSGW